MGRGPIARQWGQILTFDIWLLRDLPRASDWVFCDFCVLRGQHSGNWGCVLGEGNHAKTRRREGEGELGLFTPRVDGQWRQIVTLGNSRARGPLRGLDTAPL